jgi:hypothetical protein
MRPAMPEPLSMHDFSKFLGFVTYFPAAESQPLSGKHPANRVCFT